MYLMWILSLFGISNPSRIEADVMLDHYVPAHSHPYLVQMYNFWSFKNYNNFKISHNKIALFSISKTRAGPKSRTVIEYMATYNLYAMYYEFNQMRFSSYESMIDYILYIFE